MELSLFCLPPHPHNKLFRTNYITTLQMVLQEGVQAGKLPSRHAEAQRKYREKSTFFRPYTESYH
jgi:hypothetical protein